MSAGPEAPAGSAPASAAGLRLAFSTLSILRLRVDPAEAVDRRNAGTAMACAPLVGLTLGAAAALAGWAALRYTGSATLAAVAAVAVLAALTRGLHLDGLADTADGLGSAKRSEAALAVMKRSDIGPFGVVTVVLVLAAQITALAVAYGHDHGHGAGAGFGRGAVAVITAAVAGRLAITLACTAGFPPARPDGLGAWVARSVSVSTAMIATALSMAVCVGLGTAVGNRTAVLAGVAIPFSLLVAALLLHRCIRRFGGITGDVLGALVETATAAALLVLASH